MSQPEPEALPFRRCQFSTSLPARRLYTSSHYWLSETSPGKWRIGLTSFATRMLGEIVELEIESPVGLDVSAGDRLGWIEGFKAVSDLYSVATGSLVRVHAEAVEDTARIARSPHAEGWLYEVEGTPTGDAIPVNDYIRHLEATIDRLSGADSVSDPPPAPRGSTPDAGAVDTAAPPPSETPDR